LALAAAYEQFKDPYYLEDALTIGNWIHGNLKDTTYTGYGGYYLGYPDKGIVPKNLQKGKSTENNADIFAAFLVLADLERQRGHQAEADQWTLRAYIAGDFVMAMYDIVEGRFYAGTVPVGTPPGPGIDPSGNQRGEDVINLFDFLDSNTFSTLALATFPRFRDQIDWRRPIQYALDTFAQSITAGNNEFHGFSIVNEPVCGPNGIAWEFTAQAVVAMRFVDRLYGDTRFEEMADFYLSQICQAQIKAPFGDQRGLVASTLQDGDQLPPLEHCLSTPFQCIPQRVGLAATTWAIFADKNVNPFPTLDSDKLYVDWASGIDGNNDCTNPAHPCKTIGHALDQAEDGDVIMVAKGTYTENLIITKTVTLKGAYEPAGWSRSLRHYTTTIDGSKNGRVIEMKGTFPNTTVIDGFTITTGDGGIYIAESNVAIQNTKVVYNRATSSSGGGILIDHAYVTITNSIIADNEAASTDGAILIISTISNTVEPKNSYVKIDNSTIAYNRAKERNGIFCSLSWLVVVNSIIWGHDLQDISGHNYSATYSDIEMGLSGEGNISEDPRFVDPENGDYHLGPDSPCIDKGTHEGPPEIDFEGDQRPFDGDRDGSPVADMGADEYIIGICEGDIDGDRDVDGSDLAKFASYYSEGDFAADLNGDGVVDTEDVKLFAEDFGRIDCPMQPQVRKNWGSNLL
jgi:hypothetical protein